MNRWLVAPALVTMLVATSAHAAPDKQACVDAATRGQHSRNDGKLRAARDAFTLCSDTACPGLVRDACVGWLADVSGRMPRIVVRVEDGSGEAITGASLRLDGEATTFTPGATVQVDPGDHVVEVVVGRRAVQKDFTVTERESRTVVVVVPAASPPPPPPPAPALASRAEVPTWSSILGGVALVGVGSFAYFGLRARSDNDDGHHAACGAELACVRAANASIDDSHTEALVADVSLGVGLAAAVGAVVVWATSDATGSPRAVVGWTRGGAVLSVGGAL